MCAKDIFIVKQGTERMRCNVFGELWRPEIGMNKPSGNWIIRGAVRFNNFGYIVETFTLKEVLLGKLQWKHKNGKQRIHIKDIDHGTFRTWMSPGHEVLGKEEVLTNDDR